jgi:hypothetical protein
VKYLKKTWLIICLITLTASCATSSSQPTALAYPKPEPAKSLKLAWQDDGDRVSLSKEDAVKLMQWLLDVEAFIDHH